MRVLLDECVDWRLLRELPNHDVRTVRQVGWEYLKNGALLSRAATQFDVFVTVDQNLPYQQNAIRFDIAVVVLRAGTTRLPDLLKLIPALNTLLSAPEKGTFQVLDVRDVPL